MSKASPIAIDRSWLGAPAQTLRNPTWWLFVGVVFVWTASTAAALVGHSPWWVSGLVNAVASYLAFTVMHESVHGIAHANKRANAWMGRVAGVLLVGSSRMFRAVHLEHHAHTNDPERDPDFGVARTPRWMMPLWCLAIVVDYRRHWFGRPLWRADDERREALVVEGGLVIVALALSAAGWGQAVFTLWVAPALAALLVLAFAFDYLPHAPHIGRGRYLDTRAMPSALGNIALLGQNYHLVHHLWATIPWYRYQRAFRALEPELRARGCDVGQAEGAVGRNTMPSI